MVSAVTKVQIKCYGGSAERDPGGRQIREGFPREAVSAWALKGTEENIPGGENSKTKGTETRRPGVPSRNGDRAQRKNGTSSGGV